MNAEQIKIWIKDNLFNAIGNLDSNKLKTRYTFMSLNLDKFEIIKKLTSFTQTESISERIYLICNDLTDKPICSTCNSNHLKFITFKYGYQQYCCQKCQTNSQIVINKRIETCLSNFGTKYPMQSKEVQDTMINNNLQKYGVKSASSLTSTREKVIDTVVDRYGVFNVFQSEIIKKIIKETNFEKYGVEHHMQNEYMKKKFSDNIFEKYGVPWTSLIPEKIEKTILTRQLNTRKNKKDKELYYYEVWKTTNNNFKEFYYQINPEKMPRNVDYHLDHIMSIYDGFKNNIPVYIIAHPNNLRIIPRAENISKNRSSLTTIDEILKV